MKKIPVSIGHFRTLIEENYVYVDKTRIIYNFLQKNRCLFLSRPRRFGKTLLVSLLGELFAGNKELFKDTWIGRESDYAFKKHQVLHFSFSQLDIDSAQSVNKGLIYFIEKAGREYGIDLLDKDSLGTKIDFLVEELSKQASVLFWLMNMMLLF